MATNEHPGAGGPDASGPEGSGREVDQQRPINIVADNVHVTYKVEMESKEAQNSMNAFQKLQHKLLGKSPTVEVKAVRGATFVAREGESIGLIGRNGSGKSTLLRMIAGLEQPTQGQVLARTTPTLLGVGAALIPALSGEKNIILGCLAMGMTTEEAEAAVEPVAKLAAIGDSIFLPMRTYSSGMAARVKFAIATASNPQILLVDEALSTGDAAFKARSEERMRELLAHAGTVFLVSHSAGAIEDMCRRVIWLNEGETVCDGPTEEVMPLYRKWAHHISRQNTKSALEIYAEARALHQPVDIQYVS